MKYLILILVFISAPLFAAQGNMDSKYVIYNVDDQTFAERDGRVRRVDWPTVNGGPLGDDFPSNLRYLEITEGSQPNYDPATQKLSPRVRAIDIPNTEWRNERTVIALTQQELDDRAAAEETITNAEDCQAPKAGIRPAIQDMLNATGNQAQRIVRIETWMVRMIRCTWPDQTGPLN